MPLTSAAAVVAALAALAAPAKQSWESSKRPEVTAEFLPRSAAVEVDGEAKGRGFVALEVADPKRTFRIRVSAEGFEPEEKVVEAGRVANRQFFLALRPAGFGKKVDPADAASMALASSALWRAGRADDAADYAEQSLSTGNSPLANRVMGDVWRRRGDRDKAVRYYTMYLSLTDNPPDAPEIKAWLMQPKPGDITVPAQ
ncbi:MAG TPA: tetratricopeptide repeat protein [Anaeromyxobacteraceae bacterium]|nr:tetratricopeptide repeat protein [Anaeromyxobacteraceae bacterium]